MAVAGHLEQPTRGFRGAFRLRRIGRCGSHLAAYLALLRLGVDGPGSSSGATSPRHTAMATRATLPLPPPTVAAVLAPTERAGLDAASVGCFSVLYRSSVPEAVRTVRERAVDAVLLSVHQCIG